MTPLRLTLALAAVLAAAGPAAAQTLAVPQAVRDRIDRDAREIHPAITEVRRDIHRHPELGFRETRTAALVAERLKALGYEVRTGVGVTGVVGVLRGGKPGPVVAIRADMDALPIPELIDVPYKSTVPNVKHACGHDAHTAMTLGVAEIFSRMRADLPGTVKFLFQPAEEGDPEGGRTGALRMLDDKAFEDPAPAAIFGMHVMPTLEVGQLGANIGPAMASSDRFTVTITGKKTHGAYPHTGIDPVPIAAQVIMALQTIPSRQIDAQKPTVVTVGIVQGGNRFNIVADEVSLTGTVRSLDTEGPSIVKGKMDAIVKGITSSFGATYTLEYEEGAPVTFNDPALARASLPALEATAGPGKVLSPPAQMGAEDFAYFQQRVPGFYFFVGVANPARNITAMVHTEYFDIDEAALGVGMRAMATAVADYLYRASRQ
ncbi:MAG TPA: amidohydrolase [Vicinamibacterales bacterium]|nr:amidohydrolase [Vicinamibacterales bacterium]